MTRGQLITFLLGNVLLLACQSGKTRQIDQFHTINYTDVGKRMEQVQPPYVIDVANGSKRLVFIGCTHVRDSTHKQFTVIQQYFSQLKPQVAFNEGGQMNKSLRYPRVNKAILDAGETGCLKYLSDQAGIRLVNGDTPDSLEFALTLKRYPKEELYLYYVMERIVIPYLSMGSQQESFESYFNEVITSFVQDGFPLTSNEQSLSYFKELYQKYVKRPFVLRLNEDVEKFDYVNGGDCHFCLIGRVSKMTRDSILLTKLDQALDHYDRIIVTFGHGHALAVEPALKQIIAKKRN
ncbi:hypothetical protein [Spirosoma sp.]|uniref:hypothetical protein n=1 Tax=Spirosoma sp. TaxID=1899569 RepID=UPI003B3AB814